MPSSPSSPLPRSDSLPLTRLSPRSTSIRRVQPVPEHHESSGTVDVVLPQIAYSPHNHLYLSASDEKSADGFYYPSRAKLDEARLPEAASPVSPVWSNAQPPPGAAKPPPPPQRLSFFLLYSLTSRATMLSVVLPAALFSTLAGLIPPYMTQLVGVAFGHFITYSVVFSDPSTTPDQLSEAKAALLSNQKDTAIQFCALAAAVLITSVSAATLWTISSERIARDLRRKIFLGIGRKDMAWFDLGMGSRDTENSEGEDAGEGDVEADGIGGLVGRFTKDTDDVRQACSQYQGMILQYFVSFLACLGLSFYHSYLLTFVILASVPIIVTFVAVTERLALKYGLADREYSARQSSILDVFFTSLPTLKAFNATDTSLASFTALAKHQQAAYNTQHFFWGIRTGGTQFVMLSMFVQGFWFGAYLVRIGRNTAASVNTCFWACLLATTFLQSAVPLLVMIEKGKIAMAGLLELAREEEPPPRPVSFPAPQPTARKGTFLRRPRRSTRSSSVSSFNFNPQSTPTSPLSPRSFTFIPLTPTPRNLRKLRPTHFSGELSLQDVSFSYPSRPMVPVLQNVSLYLAARETTYIVGTSGSGKSTVGSLLLGLYEPDTGRVEVDEQGLEWIDKDWLRGHVAAVSQGQSALFDGTVHANVAMGVVGQLRADGTRREAKDVSREEVVKACRAALVHDFVRDLPDGYDTWLSGEKGASLSGGQRQRLALARAWIRDPTVLILDEATSALDATSRQLVADALKCVRKNKTTIVITHDLTTIGTSDFVYVLANGRVVEEGYRSDLEKNEGGPFWEMAHGSEAVETVLDDEVNPAWTTTSPSLLLAPPPTFSLLPPIDPASAVAGSPSQRYPSPRTSVVGRRSQFEGSRPTSRLSYGGSPISIDQAHPIGSRASSYFPTPMQEPPPRVTPFGVLAPRELSTSTQSWQDVRRASQVLHQQLGLGSRRESSLAIGFGGTGMSRSSSAPGQLDLTTNRRMSDATHLDFGWNLERQRSFEAQQFESHRRSLAQDPRRHSTKTFEPRRSSTGSFLALDHVGRFATNRRALSTGLRTLPVITTSQDGAPAVVIEFDTGHRHIPFGKLCGLIYATVPTKPLLFLGLGFSVFVGACTPVFSWLLAKLMANIGDVHSSSVILQTSLLILLLAFLEGIGTFIKFSSLERCAMHWTVTLRTRMLALILKQDKAWFDCPENSATNLTYAIVKDTEDARILIGTIAGSICVIVAMITMSLTWAFVVGWELTLVGLGLGPVFIIVTRVQAGIQAKYECQNKTLREDLSIKFHQTVSNVRAIRSMAIETTFEASFEESVCETYDGGRRAAPLAGLGLASAGALTYVAEATLFYVGAVLIVHGRYTFYRMLQVFTLIVFAVTFTGQIMGYLPMMTKSIVAASDLWRILELSEDTSESRGTVTYPVEGHIAFNDVTFSYPQRPHYPVLKKLSFEVHRGECVGIVGASGSGKSTIAALLQRLYDPDSGSVTLDGHSLISTNVHYLRDHLAVVSQHPALFDMTVSENIAYGLESFSQDDVVRAAKAAQVHDFIVSLPNGYDTLLGENASLISGGQAQRLQIARALIQPREILILDECTSALDPANQAAVMETIGKVKKGKTTLVITHKLAVMESCDRLLVIVDGVVAEQGTVAELRSRGGAFAKLATGGNWETT